MKFPYTWKPTGWFMIGWGEEFPTGQVRPLHYFSEDLVAYRAETGELQVLSAHCPHLGAHIGHGGKVKGDCVECPYHGWGYGPDGVNRYIPYEDRPNLTKRLRSWPTREQNECVFMWHDPAGGPPRWELPDIFAHFTDLPNDPGHYYRAYPEASLKYEGEPVHPQLPLENGPDSAHFRYVHGSSVDPVLIDWHVDANEYHFDIGWASANAAGTHDMGLRTRGVVCGIGGTMNVFEGSGYHYRLIFWTTPVDEGHSDMFHSIWWPRDEGSTSNVLPAPYRERIVSQFFSAVEQDLGIWRYQEYVENPALAQQDARPHGAMRKWASKYYEV
jgi:phenylpropionate dioxygenase-like ring-hydroxylating dioxygenase large terminal subunit